MSEENSGSSHPALRDIASARCERVRRNVVLCVTTLDSKSEPQAKTFCSLD